MICLLLHAELAVQVNFVKFKETFFIGESPEIRWVVVGWRVWCARLVLDVRPVVALSLMLSWLTTRSKHRWHSVNVDDSFLLPDSLKESTRSAHCTASYNIPKYTFTIVIKSLMLSRCLQRFSLLHAWKWQPQWLKCNGTQGNAVPPPPISGSKAFPHLRLL